MAGFVGWPGGLLRGGVMTAKRTLRFVARVAVLASLGTGIGVVAYRAGERAIKTAPPAPVAAQPTLVTASAGTLIDAGPVQVSAQWLPIGSVLNRRTGTITDSSVAAGMRVEITAGELVYKVDDLAVVVMPGSIPAYRDLGPTTVGFDVAQLQSFLAASGYFTAPADGKWGVTTTTAWRSWRESQGLPRLTTAPLGSIIFSPTLPFTASVHPEIRVGGVISDGDTAFDILDTLPAFTVTVAAGATSGIAEGLAVTASIDSTTLDFTTTAKQTPNDQGNIDIDLKTSRNLKCESWCDAIPTDQVSMFPGTVTRAGPATGVIVPVGAVHSGSGSDLFVVSSEGKNIPVTVTLQVGGQAILDGVHDGDRILLPSTPG
jgi:peptidoglycan hydrolase-like protein with peptidoglycan-binding domain